MAFEYIVPDNKGTHVTSTININRNMPLSRQLYIDLTMQLVKRYKTVIIHAPSEFQMRIFINKLNTVLKKSNLPKLDKSKLVYRRKVMSSGTSELDWYGMPEFRTNDSLKDCIDFNLEIEIIDMPLFRTLQEHFHAEFGQSIFPTLKYIWFPKRNDALSPIQGKMYVSTGLPRYPIYVISKGRHERRLTSKYLEWSKVPYKIVVEPQEYELYAQHIDPSKILVLPQEYLGKNQGGIPARNFVWEHSKKLGAARHWILDDNIASYKRFNLNQKILLRGGAAFSVLEDYVDRYTNVKMAGHNYTFFAVQSQAKVTPVTLNTRVYSSILLSNDLFPEFAWRGVYNEDTDLSLRVLKAGYPTVLFNCILAEKTKTLTQKGGNTDTIYRGENSMFLKASSLQEQHPDVATVVTRFKRVHHHVNYDGFKGLKPMMREDCSELPPNEYGMVLVKKDNRDRF